MIQAYFKSNIWVIFKQCYSVFLIKLTTAIISASTPLYCHCNREIFEKKLFCCLWDCMPPILSLLLTKFALNTAFLTLCYSAFTFYGNFQRKFLYSIWFT